MLNAMGIVCKERKGVGETEREGGGGGGEETDRQTDRWIEEYDRV